MTDNPLAPTERFTRALVRRPARSLIRGLTEADLGIPDYALACQQFEAYVRALRALDVVVTEVAADEACPDCVFIEDTALVTPGVAILTRPGAPSRRAEVPAVREALSQQMPVREISSPGMLDAGDVMNVDGFHYIGLSSRTNSDGARQLIAALRDVGLDGQTVAMPESLHFKTGVNYLDAGRLLVATEFLTFLRANDTGFPLDRFEVLEVSQREAYAANSLWINGTVLVPAGFPETAAMIEQFGYPVVTLATDEFRKLDGGLSCLSLRY
ncbi:MAG: N(G),N(G)-dimethylarginine dimethylaminohydrolase [Pseudomonadota bacterium]